MVAAELALRATGIPLLDLLEAILGREVVLKSYEDNDTAILAIKNGYSQRMRHLQRIHGVNIRALHERYHGNEETGQPAIGELIRKDTLEMRADIFTKPFDSVPKWNKAVELIGITGPSNQSHSGTSSAGMVVGATSKKANESKCSACHYANECAPVVGVGSANVGAGVAKGNSLKEAKPDGHQKGAEKLHKRGGARK